MGKVYGGFFSTPTKEIIILETAIGQAQVGGLPVSQLGVTEGDCPSMANPLRGQTTVLSEIPTSPKQPACC